MIKCVRKALARNTSTRLIPIDIKISRHGDDTIALSASTEGIGTVTVTTALQHQKAQNDPVGHRRRQLSKWGDTIFTVAGYDDRIPDEFIAASQLADMRRRLAAALMSTLAARKEIPRNSKARLTGSSVRHPAVTPANVSNSLAEKFYKKCGVTGIEPAIELKKTTSTTPLTLMETRYCIRRQLGACLKEGGGTTLPEPLTLRGQGFEFNLSL